MIMVYQKSKRFSKQEVTKGKHKGSLHVSTESYQQYFSELVYLGNYLDRRLLPTDPEEVCMRGIILNFQNILEHESEELVNHYVHLHPSISNQKFKGKIDNGFMSFKCKFEWLYKKSLISDVERDIMEELRLLRNANIHVRPSERRRRFKYFKKPLLTKASLRKMFVDVEKVLQKLRIQSGRKVDWGILPPGYALDMNWPKSAIAVFEKK